MSNAKQKNARRMRDALRRLVVAHASLDDARRPCGAPLSAPHAFALLELLAEDGPMTVSQLATKLHIDRSNVSRLCAKMQQAGELDDTPHPEDGRATLLRLTPHGRNVANSVDASSAKHFSEISARLALPGDDVIAALEHLAASMAGPTHLSKPEEESQ